MVKDGMETLVVDSCDLNSNINDDANSSLLSNLAGETENAITLCA